MAKNIADPIGITPAPGHYIVIPEEQSTIGNITVSQQHGFQEQIGTVVAVGIDVPYETDPKVIRKPYAKIGDRIYHKTWNAQPIQFKDKKIRIIPFNDLLGIIND